MHVVQCILHAHDSTYSLAASGSDEGEEEIMRFIPRLRVFTNIAGYTGVGSTLHVHVHIHVHTVYSYCTACTMYMYMLYSILEYDVTVHVHACTCSLPTTACTS